MADQTTDPWATQDNYPNGAPAGSPTTEPVPPTSTTQVQPTKAALPTPTGTLARPSTDPWYIDAQKDPNNPDFYQGRKSQLDDWVNWVKGSQFSNGTDDGRGTGFAGGAAQYRNPQGLQALADAYNASHPGQNAKPVFDSANDKIDFGFGPVDVITAGGQYWYDNGNSALGPLAQQGSGGGAGGGSAAGGSGGATGSIPGGQLGYQDPRMQQLYNELVARSNQSLNVDPNDPIIKAQVDAFRNAQTRGQRANLAALAEQAGPNSNQTAETRHAGEVVGQQTAGMQAELMGREVDARRKEIADALNGRFGVLSAAQQAQLHREDELLQSRSLDIQSQLGNRGYDVQSQLGNRNADISANANDNAAAQNAWQNQYDILFGKGY